MLTFAQAHGQQRKFSQIPFAPTTDTGMSFVGVQVDGGSATDYRWSVTQLADYLSGMVSGSNVAAGTGIRVSVSGDTAYVCLKSSGVTPGIYGSTSKTVTVKVDSFGRIDSIVQNSLSTQKPFNGTVVKTSNYTASSMDVVACDASGGSFTVTLPSSPSVSDMVVVKLINVASTYSVTVTGGTFNKSGGPTSLSLTLLNQGVVLEYGAASLWYIISDDLPLSQLDSRYLQVETDPIATAKTITATNGYGITGLSGTAQTVGANPTITPAVDTTVMAYKTWVLAHSGTGTVTNVIGGTNISITGTSTIQPTVNITGTLSTANGGTGTTLTTSLNGTPVNYGTNNILSIGITSVIAGTNVTVTGTTTPTVSVTNYPYSGLSGAPTIQTTINGTVVANGSNNTITAAPSGSAGGSLGGTYPAPIIASSVNLPGSPTTTTQAAGDNSTKVATTAYVDQYMAQTTTSTNVTTSYTPTTTITNSMSQVQVNITAQAGSLTFNNPTGTWANDQILLITIKDNGTSQTLAWGTNYAASSSTNPGVLPTATVLGREMVMEMMYNSNLSKWLFVGYAYY